ncbi:hypothetical protein ATEIFO6365_0011012200 [Aspergillus terreus]|uniref:Uncharacterized protein n=1 Tax=Aspergillus terreus TaxID=33178 RepID=A0A5M3YYB6_ASPTE|nr:hypothetical protein ATETN484_0006012200 [Aspergillus terreus]GFF19863.1 hypothetical protein ATEIFO6365_0011012200 [Aspergillus terreus]
MATSTHNEAFSVLLNPLPRELSGGVHLQLNTNHPDDPIRADPPHKGHSETFHLDAGELFSKSIFVAIKRLRHLRVEFLPGREKIWLREWVRFCYQLTPHVTPHALDLVVVAHVLSPVLCPLFVDNLRLLPPLRRCTVCLGPGVDLRLRYPLARTLRALTAEPKNERRFNFSALPGELQELVLRHTELIAPVSLVWATRVWMPSRYEPDGVGLDCTNVPCQIWCSAREPQWAYPVNMFRVSDDFSELAFRVFYSGNVFRLADNPEVVNCERAFPPQYLKHVAYLHCDVLPTKRGAAAKTVEDFAAAICRVAAASTMHKLTVTMQVVQLISSLQGVDMDAWCRSAFRYMYPCRGVKDFFVYRFPPECGFRRGCELPESWLEKAVMGADYDRSSRRMRLKYVCVPEFQDHDLTYQVRLSDRLDVV